MAEDTEVIAAKTELMPAVSRLVDQLEMKAYDRAKNDYVNLIAVEITPLLCNSILDEPNILLPDTSSNQRIHRRLPDNPLVSSIPSTNRQSVSLVKSVASTLNIDKKLESFHLSSSTCSVV